MAVRGDSGGLQLLNGGQGDAIEGHLGLCKQSVYVRLLERHSAKPWDTPGVNLQSLSRVTPGRAGDTSEP